jgi:hypothetical protein
MAELTSCPECQRKLRVPENLIGQSVKCPSCDAVFHASLDTAIPPPLPAQKVGHEPEARPAQARRDDDYDDHRDDDHGHRSRGRDRVGRPEDDEYVELVRRGDDRPGKVQAIAIMTLVGGILATVIGLAWLPALMCLWPGGIYSIVLGIMAIIKGSKLLGRDARYEAPPTGVSVMMIINIINGDIANCVMGIINLVFLSDREVKDFFRGR